MTKCNKKYLLEYRIQPVVQPCSTEIYVIIEMLYIYVVQYDITTEHFNCG